MLTLSTAHCRRPAGLTALLLLVASGVWAAGRPTVDRLRTDLARILSAPEYQQAEMPWLRKVLRRVADWLARLLSGWWGDGVYQLHETWPLLYWVIVVLLMVLLGLLVYHIGLTLVYAFHDRRPRRAVASAMEVAEPEDLRAAARQAAEEARYAEAVALLYQALIRLLDRRGVLQLDRSRTNWEYLEAVGTVPALAQLMTPLTVRLDRILYGGGRVEAAEYRACEDLVNRAWAVGEGLS